MNELTDQNFGEEVIKSEKPVLVDFWSLACPPCMMLEPIIEEIAKDFEGKVKVGKLNVLEDIRLLALQLLSFSKMENQ